LAGELWSGLTRRSPSSPIWWGKIYHLATDAQDVQLELHDWFQPPNLQPLPPSSMPRVTPVLGARLGRWPCPAKAWSSSATRSASSTLNDPGPDLAYCNPRPNTDENGTANTSPSSSLTCRIPGPPVLRT